MSVEFGNKFIHEQSKPDLTYFSEKRPDLQNGQQNAIESRQVDIRLSAPRCL